MSLLEEGQTIRGTYEVERFLGAGAFAEVYRVKHRFLGRQAMKVFRLAGITLDEIQEMLGEALMLSRINHPNIVRVFDADIADLAGGSRGFFTMEYVAGGSLDNFWRSFGSQFMPVETAIELVAQVCRGLQVAHSDSPPIVHRDIKPQNVLVGYDAGGLRARVSDFGLAKRVNPLTLTVTALGTRAFKAPEILRDLKADSCAGDVWAVGTTLYLLLTDRLPVPELADAVAPPLQTLERPIIPPSSFNAEVDGVLDRIALKALALAPADRYQNAGAVLTELESWLRRPPGQQATSKAAPSPETTKEELGQYSPMSELSARKKAADAMALARQAQSLSEAADLLEEAMNDWPALRDEYEYQLTMWRKGVMVPLAARRT